MSKLPFLIPENFDTDAEVFQTELSSLRGNFFNELGGVCGTFIGRDGVVYPAIASLAHLNDRASEFGDPCGLMGSGDMYEVRLETEIASIEVDRVIQEQKNVQESIEIEKTRVARYCAVNEALVEYEYQRAADVIGIQTTISGIEVVADTARTAFDMAESWLSIAECEPPTVGTANSIGGCPHSAVSSATLMSLGAPLLIAEGVSRAAIVSLELGAARIEADTAKYIGIGECDFARVDSEAAMFEMLLELNLLQLDLMRATYELKLILSRAQRLHHTKIGLLGGFEDAQQLLINVEAARNDPNVRIYRNDAIINAERSFNVAIQEVFRATRVYEYFTSQSYAKKEELFLARMVEVGDVNLVNYLVELETSFNEFQESFGNPDTRVAVLSLRDDILAIPTLHEDLTSVAQGERVMHFREALNDGSHIDNNGYLSFSFATSFERLSPLTRNHKMLFAEVEIIGQGTGDNVGRVYLKQNGTSTVQAVDGERAFYQLPERTAVLNPFFNGDRSAFATDTHRNYRLRDRPFVNSAWTLTFNQLDEFENGDINLNGVDDIRVYLYYTDFTEF